MNDPVKKKKIAILISGRGSNMEVLIEACRDPAFPAFTDCVISDRVSAAGLAIARGAGVAIFTVERADFTGKQAFEAKIREIILQRGVEYICLAGFMRILSPEFCAEFIGKIINIHPSLLPAFPGVNTHARALSAGVKFSGCTVHYVNEGVDEGKIITQAIVPVHKSDDENRLAKKILRAEHIIYPAALRAVIEKNERQLSGLYFPEE